VAEGREPAITQAKNRPLALALRPGVALAARSSMIAPASRPVSGSGAAKAARSSVALACAPAGQVPSLFSH
jgi:hypothetical protein